MVDSDYFKRYRAANRERLNEQSRDWKRRNPDKVREYHLKTKYGITEEEYTSRLEAQKFVCAICEEPYSKTYHVDHDHQTGEVRGLLCDCCNRGLGYFKDSVSAMQNAISYVSSSQR